MSWVVEWCHGGIQNPAHTHTADDASQEFPCVVMCVMRDAALRGKELPGKRKKGAVSY